MRPTTTYAECGTREIGLEMTGETRAQAPDKFEPRKPLSKEQKQARKERRAADARVATAENAKTTEEFAKNRERLRAEQLAREAGEATDEVGPNKTEPATE